MPRLVNGLEQIFTSLGIVGNGYKLFFYKNGTTTPKNTYSDQSLVTPNPNPVVCDASGRPQYDIWGDDPATYKMILATPDSTLGNITPIKTIDPIDNLNANSIIAIDPLPTAYWGLTTGSSSHYTLDSLVDISSYSDKQCFFIDFHTACAASPDININGIGAINLKKYTTSGTKTALESGDIQTQRHLAIIDGVDCVILNPLKPYISGINITITQATTTSQGVVQLATNAEVLAGTNTTKAITPSNLTSLFGASNRSSNGYVRLPVTVGGAFVEIIIQWGVTGSTSGATITMPLTFPNATLTVKLQAQATSGNFRYAFITANPSTSQFSFVVNNSTGTGDTAVNVYWCAIGY